MPNTRNRKFNFGLYNSAQDSTNLKGSEAQDAYNIDVDELAMGNLRYKDYVLGTETATDKESATLSGRGFRLNSGVPEFEKNAGSADWEELNNNVYPPQPSAPTIVAIDDVNLSVNTGDMPGFTATIPTSYTGPSVRSWTVEITNNPGTYNDLSWHWKRFSDSGFRPAPIDVAENTDVVLEDGITVRFDSGDANAPGDQATLSVTTLPLEDGVYSYTMVNVKNTGLAPQLDLESLPSEPTLFTLDNISDVDGDRQANNKAQVSFDAVLPSNTDDQWLFRKDPDANDFVLVAKRSVVGTTFDDDVEIGSLSKLILLEGIDDLQFSELLTAVGATDFSHIFEKDNRIWLVPTERQDLLLYSESTDFWRFRLANTFSFNGDIREVRFIKDNSVVGGEFTTVIFTSNGIYHIVGNGTENAPYKRFEAVPDVVVQENSVVDLNGTLMITSESTAYDEGRYGRKIYEYDLSRLVEVSARARNDVFFTNGSFAVDWSKMVGGDKYIAYTSNNTRGMLYHRDVEGLMPIATDQANAWFWESRTFTVQDFQKVWPAQSRFFKFDFEGPLTFTLTVSGKVEGQDDVFTFPKTHATRAEFVQRIPRLQGPKWKISFSGDETTILHNFYFVQ